MSEQRSGPPPAETALAKYVFVDVVGFARNRSVEAQSEIVEALNSVVRESLAEFEIGAHSTIVLPTGDGLCVALINHLDPFDLTLQLALRMLAKISRLNSEQQDQQRRFEIRIGLNENVDNIVVDFNGKRNVAGAGISFAQRVMDKADGGQIMLSPAVHDKLRHRERYRAVFREFSTKDKHGQSFQVHQFIAANQAGLSVETPSAFKPEIRKVSPISRRLWIYIALAHLYRAVIIRKVRDSPILHAATAIALHFLSVDEVAREGLREFEPGYNRTPTLDSFENLINYYGAQDTWCNFETVRGLAEQELSRVASFFELAQDGDWAILSAEGEKKLAELQPGLVEELSKRPSIPPPSVADE